MILVADDDAAIRASLRLLLRQRGYDVLEAATADAALAAAARAEVELVLQDMNFSRSTGGEEGLDLLRRLRAARPELPVVLLTAWGSIPLAVAGMRAGAADFLTKPWENDLLASTVATATLFGARLPGTSASAIRRTREL